MCNLKSNKTLKEILEYKKGLQKIGFNQVHFVLFPSNLYLSFFYDAPYQLGSQNVSIYEKESVTGEVLASQLKSMKVEFVLLNHVEANETIRDVILKIKNATKVGLKVVLCMGERKHQTMEETLEELKTFLKEVLNALTRLEQENLLLAYEPVWAINSGNIREPNVLNSLVKNVKIFLQKEYDLKPIVLYGGGINVKNFSKLTKLDNIDGYLLGNCANNPENISKILENI